MSKKEIPKKTIRQSLKHLRELEIVQDIQGSAHNATELAQLQSMVAFFAKVGILDEVKFTIQRQQNKTCMHLVRTDLRASPKKRYPPVIKLKGIMTILRFLHATEMSAYELYPSYPWDRARCDQVLEAVAKYWETGKIDRPTDVPEDSIAQIVAHYAIGVEMKKTPKQKELETIKALLQGPKL